MAIKNDLIGTNKSSFIFISITAIIIITANILNVFSSAEYKISGSIYNVLDISENNEIIIVDYPPKEINRTYIAGLIQKLSDNRARSLLLDVDLSKPSINYLDDSLLMETLAANSNLKVVLPIYKDGENIIRPLPKFSKYSKTGYIDLGNNIGDIHSEISLSLNTQTMKYHHVAKVLLNNNSDIDSTYIKPGIASNLIPVINFQDLNNHDTNKFTNKHIFVGSNPDRSIINALLFKTLKQGDIKAAPWYIIILIFLVISIYLIKQFSNNENYLQILLLSVLITSLPLVLNFISIVFFKTLFPTFLLSLGLISVIVYLSYHHRKNFNISLKAVSLVNKHTVENNDDLNELLEGDISIGKNGVILKADSIAEKLLGFKDQKLIGTPLEIIAPSMKQEKWRNFYDDLINLKSPTEHLYELKAKHTNGKSICLQIQPKNNSYANSTIAQFSLRNTRGKSGIHVALEYQAKQDKISHTLNSDGVNEHLEKLISNTEGASTFSVAVLRIDNFNEIINTLGQDSAAKIIKSFANRLYKDTTASATIGRVENSDFIVVFNSESNASSTIKKQLTKLINSSKNAIHASGISVELSLHAGLANYPAHGSNPKELIKAARLALANAIHGNKSFEIFSKNERNKSNKVNNSLLEIHTALKEQQFKLFYQPIIKASDHTVCSAEALIRWKHPTKGLVKPSEFISQIEHSKLVRPVTKWIINTALKDARELAKRGLDISISVNISEINLLDAHFPSLVADCIKTNKMSAKNIEFEISEKKLHLISEQAIKLLSRLKSCGINFSLDNYGAENTSLLNLRELPFSRIKIHRSLVSKVIKSPQDEVVIDTIARLAHGFDISVVAEGVESELHYKKLRQLGIDYCQGHLFSSPVSKNGLIRLFENWDNTIEASQEIPAQAMATWNGQYNSNL